MRERRASSADLRRRATTLARPTLLLLAVTFTGICAGCYAWRTSRGAGEVPWEGPRHYDPSAIIVPDGYRVELVARDLTFPTGIAFDDAGTPHVIESGYSYGEVFTEPRLLRLEPDGNTTVVARADREGGGPWTGVTFHAGAFFIADGNVRAGRGRILRVDAGNGSIAPVVTDLPSAGDHHTNGPVISPDGWLYFSQGTATNSGVVGPDNRDFGWFPRHPAFHDIPGADIILAGVNYESEDLRAGGNGRKDARVQTGAFLPFGTPARRGQVVRGQLKCGGSILRARADGSSLELVAWGFRNPFGLAFAPDGTLYVSDNGYDDRGTRPVWGAPDVLWRVDGHTRWYGWPDFVAGRLVGHFAPPGGPRLEPVLAEFPNPPPQPAATFAVHSSADGMDFSRNPEFGYEGQVFVALFGDQAPTVGKVLAPVGIRVVRVEGDTGRIHDFAVNRGPENAPATRLGGGGLERPVAARFAPDGRALYIVDFGIMLMDAQGSHPRTGTGAIWRVTRARAADSAGRTLRR